MVGPLYPPPPSCFPNWLWERVAFAHFTFATRFQQHPERLYADASNGLGHHNFTHPSRIVMDVQKAKFTIHSAHNGSCLTLPISAHSHLGNEGNFSLPFLASQEREELNQRQQALSTCCGPLLIPLSHGGFEYKRGTQKKIPKATGIRGNCKTNPHPPTIDSLPGESD